MQYLRQDRCPEVIRVVLLSKARARNDTDPRVLQQIKSIKNIWGLTVVTGRLYGLKMVVLVKLEFSGDCTF